MRSDQRPGGRPARIATVAVVGGLVAVLGTAAPAAAAAPLQECIDRKVAEGTPLPTATAECAKELVPGVPTSTRPSPITPVPRDEDEDDAPRPSVTEDDGGTSVGLLLVAGLGRLLVGAAITALLLRRRAPGGGVPAPLGHVAAGPPAAPAGPPAVATPFAGPPGATVPGVPLAAPGATGPTGADRGPTLIVALVDLVDRVNSQALRADILAALARAGVHQIEVPAGEAFDAARMRGVGSAPTADPALVGRVAATDRPGFRDGSQVIRLPDVIVHVAG